MKVKDSTDESYFQCLSGTLVTVLMEALILHHQKAESFTATIASPAPVPWAMASGLPLVGLT